MDIKVLLLLAGVLVCAYAGGHSQHKYGFSIKGKHGSSKVVAGADEHKYSFQVDNHHKDGTSYIKLSGDNTHHGDHHEGGHKGHGGGGAGFGGGFGGFGGF